MASSFLPSSSSKNLRVLIVDDSKLIRSLLKVVLETDFEVIEAENGREGLTTAVGTIPDLIITDLMMPELDGYQLSRAIREDSSVAHVPIIMLTTVDTEFNELEGYRAGVDAYLLKPFTKEQLIVRVENMIKNRQLCLSRAPQFQPIQKASESYSEDFHRALQKQMEFQLANPDLKVKHLAEAFGLSVSTFERRIKELYETTPKLFIRNYRLDKAKEMLESRMNNVSTIARSCGFDNISYFSLCFREKFGTTPTRVMYA